MRFQTPFYAFLLSLSLSCGQEVVAQEKLSTVVDSLLNLVNTLPDDTNKVSVLSRLSYVYFNVNIKEGFRRGYDALALAQKLKWDKGIARAYSSIGTCFWASGDLVKAQDYYLKCLEIDERLGNKADIARSVHRVGVSYAGLRDKTKGIFYFERALELFKEVGDSAAVMGCHLNIGNLYEDKMDYPTSHWHYELALELAKRSQNKRDYAYILNLLGRSYASQKQFAKAIEYEKQSISVYESLRKSNDLAIQLGNAGDVYLSARDYVNAMNAYKSAIRSFEKDISRGENSEYASWFGKIGNIQMTIYKNQKIKGADDTRILDEAILNFKKAVSLCESITSWVYSAEYHKSLAEAYTLKGNYSAAYSHLKTAGVYQDSMNNSQKEDEMVKLELEYEFNKRKDSLDYQARLNLLQLENEKKVSRLAVKQQWLYSLIFLVTFSLIGAFIVFRYRVRQLRLKNELKREKTEKQLQETQYQKQLNDVTFAAVRSQMNPHFIFNALNTIQSYVYSNDKKSATNYLGKFSELIRKILDNSNKKAITLAEEIHVLQLYIDIEKARFGDNFCASIETDPLLDTEDILVPPMLVQPYVENSVKHGLLHQSGEKKLHISISSSQKKGYIDVIIDDNGIGRKKSAEINKQRLDHNSFANAANERRIELINQLSDRKTSLRIIDKENADGSPAGTTVIITLPVMIAVTLA